MGKKIVLLVVVVTLVVLIAGWLFLQNVITNFDVDRDTSMPGQNQSEITTASSF